MGVSLLRQYLLFPGHVFGADLRCSAEIVN